MSKTKIRTITLTPSSMAFSFLKKFKLSTEKEYDFSGIAALRQLLSNEKAKILHTIKNQKPKSIYELAKKLGRDFRSVSEDIKLLEKFGFINLIAEKTGNRERYKPVLAVDSMTINIEI